MFTASNGVKLNEEGAFRGGANHTDDVHGARKEFYRQLRDKELGRWRDPVLPDFVVYKKSNDCIRVVDERGGVFTTVIRGHEVWDSKYSEVATRYFEAHPEPRPWQDAKPGESWVLTFEDGTEESQTVNRDGDFYPWVLSVEIDRVAGRGTITDGRRIWPEGDDDA